MTTGAPIVCRPPEAELTVPQAHQSMQNHLLCPTQDCPHRAAALTTLVNTGRYRLAGPAPTAVSVAEAVASAGRTRDDSPPPTTPPTSALMAGER